ncbi:hypothetical protein [Paenibacillus montanisoli]|uniref:Uncharacterized protein n=1 Tax=Paenibacillus montanisoli TaxID=2081970 RepID=A0A328U0Z0_9BACL|nr:hypothetical protein [Paenibacillus montanisoli]RAP73666.1 hypothetical protein DL346_25705 [Paenibacillus montanisoli]
MLTYKYDSNIIRIQEIQNEKDVEFSIHILQEKPYAKKMKQVQKAFDENDVITDVFFYVLLNHEYRVIVRRDFYADFVLEMMKQRLLQSVEWITT